MTGENFSHLHNHTYYSLLDGLSSPTQMAQEAKRQGFKSLAITDHGTCGGWLNFQRACRKEDIKPILGCEFYLSENMKSRDKTQDIYHLTLLAKDSDGLKNLMHLSTLAGVEGFYKKPRIDFDLLAQNSKGIICSSGCPASELSHAVVDEDWSKCKNIVGKYKDLFGDDYYLEIMSHQYGAGKEEWQVTERKIAKTTFNLSRKLGIKAICTNDAHYASKSDAESHDTLLCVQTRANINNPKRFSFRSDDFYLKSYEEMLKIYGKSPDLLKNTVEISEKITDEELLKFVPDLLPHFQVPDGFKDELHYLKSLVKDRMIAYGFMDKPEYRERIKFEMGVIANCGYVKYFLILWDIINFSNQSNIRTGIARGSAAGSLVLYVLGITKIDPVKYDLLFERFLNPERVSPPDVDVDFDYYRRNEIYDYIYRKYGQDHCCKIGTYNSLQSKAVVRYCAKALDIGNDWKTFEKRKKQNPYEKIEMTKNSLKMADFIAKKIPISQVVDTSIEAQLRDNHDFRNSISKYPKLMRSVRNLEGVLSSSGVHPAGIVICKDRIDNYIPLRENKGQVCSQFDGPEVEDLGLLKFDLLALKTLTIIEDTLKAVKNRHNIEIDIDNLEPNDKKVFSMLNGEIANMDNRGVFQFESDGMSKLLKTIHVDSFNDMSVANALYRPGPLGAKIHELYADYKHGRKPIKPLHPKMGEILKDTYGLMCFQEDQEVYTSKGPKKIVEVCTGGDILLSFSENKIIKTRSNKLLSQGSKRVYRYTFSNGQSVTCTDDHRILSMCGRYKSIDEIFQENESVPYVIGNIEDIFIKKGHLSFCYFLGAMIGDGNCKGSSPTFCCGHNKDYGKKMGNLFLDLYPEGDFREFFSTRSNYIRFIFPKNKKKCGLQKKNDLKEKLKEMSLFCKSKDKRVPFNHIIEGRQSYLSLLAGLLDTDGCVGKELWFSSISNGLLRDIQYVLWRLGYRSYVSSHTVHVWRSRDLYEELSPYLLLKSGLEELVICNGNNIKLCPRVIKEKVNKSFEVFGGSVRAFCKEKKVNRSSFYRLMESGSPYVKKGTFQNILSNNEIEDSCCLWITNKEDLGTRKVYDLSINHESHNFLASGLVVHNCFQEDFMKVSQELAGFTKGQSDTLRKAVGKKKMDLLQAQKELFVNGCVENGISASIAEKIFEQIEFFGGYGFNMSHSVAYAFLAYQCCYLKIYYPIEFMTALLSSEIDNNDKNVKLRTYISQAQLMGITVAGTNINKSGEKFRIESVTKKDGSKMDLIRSPITMVDGVGLKACESIAENQPFNNLEDFLRRTDCSKVNSKVFSALVHAGGMDAWRDPEGEVGVDNHRSFLISRYETVKKKVMKEKNEIKKQTKYKEQYGGGSIFDSFSGGISI